jgi:aminoglycoside phosphotransferase (APT) family kinase protein
VPPPTGVPTLVHGDLKPAKMLWRDGELVSLLDWEMSFNGDPAWDLGYMLIFLPGDLHPQIPGNCDLCACGAAINSSRHGRKGPDVLSPTVCGSRRPPMRKSHR